MNAAPQPNYYRMTLSAFARANFAGKPPSRNTLKSIIDRGDWLGERLGCTHFIFVDGNGQPIPGTKTAPSCDPVADAILLEWERSRK